MMGFHITVNKEQAVVPRGGDEASSPSNLTSVPVQSSNLAGAAFSSAPTKALVETYWNVDLAQSGLTRSLSHSAYARV